MWQRALSAGGGGGTDHFQKLLGMGEYDAVSSTQAIPTGTDFIVIVPAWIASANVGTNKLMPTGSAYTSGDGELYYLENVGDSLTITKVYQGSETYEGGKSTTVTWTSATKITVSRVGETAGGVFCFYFANK